MNERLEAVVSGRVQLVMYRDFTLRKARSLGLVGEVENMPDGTVRIIAEGTRGRLEELVLRLKKGSLLSNVERLDLAWGATTGEYKTFDITYG
jgi:acylphosphatase